jgi:hypothetical protein
MKKSCGTIRYQIAVCDGVWSNVLPFLYWYSAFAQRKLGWALVNFFFSFNLSFLFPNLEIDASYSKNWLCPPVSISINFNSYFFFIAISFAFNVFLNFILFLISTLSILFYFICLSNLLLISLLLLF